VSESRWSPPVTTHEWLAEGDAEHIAGIRADPGRFARGGVGHLLLEVVAHPVDEMTWGTTDRVLVTLSADGSISVEDNGRGTNVFFDEAGQVVVKPIMATRDLRFFGLPDAPSLPDGLPRCGMSVVAAMSEWLVHTNRRVEGAWSRRYEHGLPESGLTELTADERGEGTGTIVRFRPDRTIFGDATLSADEAKSLCAGFESEIHVEVVTG
jgi:DNA gyrase subunit B